MLSVDSPQRRIEPKSILGIIDPLQFPQPLHIRLAIDSVQLLAPRRIIYIGKMPITRPHRAVNKHITCLLARGPCYIIKLRTCGIAGV